MKRFFTYAFILTSLSIVLWGCPGKDVVQPDNSMTATIGSAQFNASGNDVAVSLEANPLNTSETELTITGASGNTVLTVAIPNYDNNNGTGTYQFSTSDAIGGYNSGSGADDIIVSGSVVITEAGNTIAGTFSGTTQGGTAITNGSFSVQQQ